VKVKSALDLINAIVYKPGWRISATDHRDRFEGSIIVRIDYPARNSNRDQAANGYPAEIRTYETVGYRGNRPHVRHCLGKGGTLCLSNGFMYWPDHTEDQPSCTN